MEKEHTSYVRPIKKNGYSRGGFRGDIKKIHRQDAKERNARYRALSVQDRILLVKSRPGNSARELARLEGLLIAPKSTKTEAHIQPKAKISKTKKVTKKKS